MELNEYIGRKLTCVLSKGLKDENFYNEDEFVVRIIKDNDAEDGYIATVSGYDDDNEYFKDEWSPKMVLDNLLFQNWVVVKNEKI